MQVGCSAARRPVAARRVQARGVRMVVVSLGERGVIGLDPQGCAWSASTRLDRPVVDAVGSGDALGAGCVVALARGATFAESSAPGRRLRGGEYPGCRRGALPPRRHRTAGRLRDRYSPRRRPVRSGFDLTGLSLYDFTSRKKAFHAIMASIQPERPIVPHPAHGDGTPVV